ncbi:MAG: hypothetical protein QNJ71_05035 [Acidimicrobiia bacterium]|nr:hypothetical protein [Acidimicrobiia bacterium]
MRRRSRTAALVLVGVMAVLLLAAFALPANAEVLQGDCTGGAVFSNGASVTERQPLNQVVAVPAADTVRYVGDTNLEPLGPDEKESFSGGVSVALPWGSVTVVSWSGETDKTADRGSYTYDVSGLVPEGTGGVEVTATHTQRGQTCIVAVTMSVDGDPGWQAFTAAGLTALSAVGVAGAGVKRSVK